MLIYFLFLKICCDFLRFHRCLTQVVYGLGDMIWSLIKDNDINSYMY